MSLTDVPAPPSGLERLKATLGDPTFYVDQKDEWERRILQRFSLPTPLPYAYAAGTSVSSVRAHRLLVRAFYEALRKCLEAKVAPQRIAYGGLYCWRPKRTAGELSVHTWAAAIDLDPLRNPQGTPWDGGETMMPAAAVTAFESTGFEWGGRWTHPDCMHFQWCHQY